MTEVGKPTGGVAELARIVGISTRSVRELQAADVLKRYPTGEVDLFEAVRAYCSHLRKGAAGRDEAGLSAQRARLAQAQADRTEMENRRRRGELLPADEVTTAVTGAFVRVRARLLAIPSKAAPQILLLRDAKDIHNRLTDLVHEALEELADTKVVALLDEQGRETA